MHDRLSAVSQWGRGRCEVRRGGPWQSRNGRSGGGWGVFKVRGVGPGLPRPPGGGLAMGGPAARSAAAERGGLGRARRRRMEGVFKVRGVCPRLPRPAVAGLAMVCMCPLRGPTRRNVAVSERAQRRRMGGVFKVRGVCPGLPRPPGGGLAMVCMCPLRGPPRRNVAVSERAQRRRMGGVFKVRGVCPRLPRPAVAGLAMVCMCPLRGPTRRNVAVSERARRRRMGSLLGTRCLPEMHEGPSAGSGRSRNGGWAAARSAAAERGSLGTGGAAADGESSRYEASARDCHDRLAAVSQWCACAHCEVCRGGWQSRNGRDGGGWGVFKVRGVGPRCTTALRQAQDGLAMGGGTSE
jgi:hypothetical protein